MSDKKEYPEELYGYLLHWNPFRKEWTAIPRGEVVAHFNGQKPEGVIKANCITSLITKVPKK
jgi:hypothetical protein